MSSYLIEKSLPYIIGIIPKKEMCIPDKLDLIPLHLGGRTYHLGLHISIQTLKKRQQTGVP